MSRNERFYSKKFVLFCFVWLVGANFKSKEKDNRSKQTLFGKGDLVKIVSKEAKKRFNLSQTHTHTHFLRLLNRAEECV